MTLNYKESLFNMQNDSSGVPFYTKTLYSVYTGFILLSRRLLKRLHSNSYWFMHLDGIPPSHVLNVQNSLGGS